MLALEMFTATECNEIILCDVDVVQSNQAMEINSVNTPLVATDQIALEFVFGVKREFLLRI